MKKHWSYLHRLASIGMVLLTVSVMLFSNCTSTMELKNITEYGEPHKIEMYSGGIKIREWISNGHVCGDGDGHFFTDRETGRFVRVIGDIVITTFDKDDKSYPPTLEEHLEALIGAIEGYYPTSKNRGD